MTRTNYNDIANIKTSVQKKEEEQKAIIIADIAKIDAITTSTTEADLVALHRELDGKYQSCIADWGKSMRHYHNDMGFIYHHMEINELIDNLHQMKPKLEAFMYGWNESNKVTSSQSLTASNVTVTVNNEINISFAFEQAREKVQEMTSLTDEQTQELLDKISEIENAYKENGTKKSKWEKVKPILVWLADKSFDVGMTLLPLLLQMQG